MRVPVFEHEKMLTTTDFIFSYLRLQAKREYSILLEGQIFERMTQVASTPGNIVSYLSEKSDAIERETEMT